MDDRWGALLTAVGLCAAAVIAGVAGGLMLTANGANPAPAVIHEHKLRFLAVGDLNLGRAVGQKILEGDTLFPFAAVRDTFAQYDLVFGNLESDISDQHGETQDPDNNLVFTAPPAAARSLALGGLGVVSTANNHALDYGLRATRETMQALRSGGIPFAGSSMEPAKLFDPVILERKGIRIALVACTDLMNMEDSSWRRTVTPADTGRVFPRLRSVRDSVDFIIVSYHGGEEYAGRPSARTLAFGRGALASGADLFLGHHPHVPYGIERQNGRYIVPSLGNFVFSQPSRYWTQRSFAFGGTILKDASGTRLSEFHCLPVRCGFQPVFLGEGPEADSIYERIHMQSIPTLAEKEQ